MLGSLQRTYISGSLPGIPAGAPVKEKDTDETIFSIFSVYVLLYTIMQL